LFHALDDEAISPRAEDSLHLPGHVVATVKRKFAWIGARSIREDDWCGTMQKREETEETTSTEGHEVTQKRSGRGGEGEEYCEQSTNAVGTTRRVDT
jgi:hypothetical protein